MLWYSSVSGLGAGYCQHMLVALVGALVWGRGVGVPLRTFTCTDE